MTKGHSLFLKLNGPHYLFSKMQDHIMRNPYQPDISQCIIADFHFGEWSTVDDLVPRKCTDKKTKPKQKADPCGNAHGNLVSATWISGLHC